MTIIKEYFWVCSLCDTPTFISSYICHIDFLYQSHLRCVNFTDPFKRTNYTVFNFLYFYVFNFINVCFYISFYLTLPLPLDNFVLFC